MRTITKKAFLILLVCSFILSLSFTATAKPSKCPWCGSTGTYSTTMQVTNIKYVGTTYNRPGHPHKERVYRVYKTLHEFCSSCKGYETSYFDGYDYRCPGEPEPVYPPSPPEL